MNRGWSWLLALTCSIAAGTSGAAPLEFRGRLELVIAALDPIGLGRDGVAEVRGRAGDFDHLASMQVEASLFATTAMPVGIDPGLAPLSDALVTVRNEAGFVTKDESGGVTASFPLRGTAKVCLFASCDTNPVGNLSVPLSVIGSDATAVATFAGVSVTVAGAPWTTGTVAIGTATAMGFLHGPASGTTSTLNVEGTVRLVTPVFLSTSIDSFAVVPAFATITFTFVPEPRTLVLLGAAIAGLAAYGRPLR